MKLLFLDVDGVLVIDGPDYGVTMEHFNQRALAELARVISVTGAHIVVHSSWRCHANKTQLLDEAVQSVGIKEGLFAQTKLTYMSEVNGRIFSEIRVDEILDYLSSHSHSDELRHMLLLKLSEETHKERQAVPSEDITAWAVVDDMALEEDGRLGDHFVRTNEFEGLTRRHGDQLIAILGAKETHADLDKENAAVSTTAGSDSLKSSTKSLASTHLIHQSETHPNVSQGVTVASRS